MSSSSSSSSRQKDAPKKPLSAYFFFCNQEKVRIKEENPAISFPELVREIGRRWKEMDKDGRAKFFQMAEDDKERYANDIKLYKKTNQAGKSSSSSPSPSPSSSSSSSKKSSSRPSSSPSTSHGRRRRRRLPKDPNRVKRPITAFFFFTAAKREEMKNNHPDLKVTELSKLMGKMWKELSDEDKRLYNDLAEADKKRYEDELSAAASISPKSPSMGASGDEPNA